MVVLPGTNWVCEKRDENGTITVAPLIGWQVIDGEVYPLPRSLGAEWTVRPMCDGDDRLLRTSAARLRPNDNTQRNYYR
jgi:hypothetical protein